MSLSFYLRYALRTLGRDPQRTALAMVCIAFGVMSLVGLQSVAGLFARTVVADPHTEVGGDVAARRYGLPITATQIADLDRLKAAGQIAVYTLTAENPASFLKPANSGHAHALIGQRMGVDPATYPLVGRFVFSTPTTTLAQALATPGDALITRDLAQNIGLAVGDHFSLSGAPGTAPTDLRVAAIATDTPRHIGDSVYYSLATARRVSGQPDVATEVQLLLGPQGNPTEYLKAHSWNVTTVAEVQQINNGPANVFDLMFKGAGILGLIISGIGVANTLQVLFARRTLEIAVLKTLGYQQRDLLALFGIETLLLGLAGSLLGALLAVGLSAALMGLFAHTFALLVSWSVDPGALLGGMSAGIATTLVFGTYAIVRASGARPAVLLRDQAGRQGWRAWLQTGGLLLLLGGVFTVISGVILGSALNGVGVVALAVVGSLVLGAIFGAILFGAVRLPLPRLRLLVMSQRSLKRGRGRAIFPLIALWAGVFTIGLATMVISQATDRFARHGINTGGANLYIYAHVDEVRRVQAELAQHTIPAAQVHYAVEVGTTAPTGQYLPRLDLLQGRDPAAPLTEVTIHSGPAWGTARDGVYVPQPQASGNEDQLVAPSGAQVGNTLTVTGPSGQSRRLPVVGTYVRVTSPNRNPLLQPFSGLLASHDTALALGNPATTAVTLVADAPPDQLTTLSDALGRALPTTTVISLADANDAIQRIFRDLLTLAIAVAGLALVAGAILIANAVGLAMVERRREVGILKAIGFNSGQVLETVLLEQGLLGVIGGALGMIGVALAIVVIDQLQPAAKLTFDLPQAALLTVVTTAFAMIAALLVAWQPTHVRPLTVLRED